MIWPHVFGALDVVFAAIGMVATVDFIGRRISDAFGILRAVRAIRARGGSCQ
jgi:hypothetical protein